MKLKRLSLGNKKKNFNQKLSKKLLSALFIFVFIFTQFSFGSFLFPIKSAKAATNLDNVNGIYTDDFADISGLSSRSNTEIVNGKLVLTKAGSDYNASGYAVLNDIRPLMAAKWGTVSITGTFPEGTSVKLQVMDDGGTLYSDTYLPNNSTGASPFPVDLSNISVLSCANSNICNRPMAVRLKLILETTDPSITPEIDSLTFNWTLKQGDLSSSALSSGPWPADYGDQKGTNQSSHSNASVYPALRWVSDKYIGNSMIDNLYVLNDKLFGWSGFNNGQMFTMNKDNGSQIWGMPFTRGTSPKGLITQNGTYYGTDWGVDNFIAIDTNTSSSGQIKWAYNFYSGHGNGQVVLGDDGTTYTVRNGTTGPASTLYAFNPDGTIKFTKNYTYSGVSDSDQVNIGYMSVGTDGTLYYDYNVYDSNNNVANKGKLEAVNLADGSVKWEYSIDDSYNVPLIGPAGTIYVPNEYGDLYALKDDGDHATLLWKRNFGTGSYFDSLALRSDGNLWGAMGDSNYMDHLIELSTADGSTIWYDDTGSNGYNIRSDGLNGVYFADSNWSNQTNLDYYDANHNLKWQIPYTFDNTAGGDNINYVFANPVLDQRGWMYSGLGKNVTDQSGNNIPDQQYAEVFALAPWTLSATPDSTHHRPNDVITLTATSSMLQSNPLFGGDDQMQAVMDNGDKVALSYSSTDSSGNTVWTGSYALPSDIADGTHSYTLEASQPNIQTDITTHFDSAPTESNNTGITMAGAFIVDTAPPTLTITSPEAGDIISADDTITFTDSKETNPQCSLDNTNWTNCTSGVTSFSNLTGWNSLQEKDTFTLYLKDTDDYNKTGTASVANLTKADTIASVRSDGSPSGELSSGTISATLSLKTDENATCKYDTASKDYADMGNTFSTTGGQIHSQTINNLSSGNTYSYYVRCQDGSGNTNDTDYLISFSIGTQSSNSNNNGNSNTPEKAKIDSWSASPYTDQTTCPQKIKLTIKGHHFQNNTEVRIGNTQASSTDKKSSQEITASFCLSKLLDIETNHQRSVSVKNPDTGLDKDKAKIDLDSFLPKKVISNPISNNSSSVSQGTAKVTSPPASNVFPDTGNSNNSQSDNSIQQSQSQIQTPPQAPPASGFKWWNPFTWF